MKKSQLQDKAFLKEIDTMPLREQWIKITVLDWDEHPIEDIQGKVTQGSININGNSALRRTGNLTMLLDEDDQMKVISSKNLISINKKISVDIGLTNFTTLYQEEPIIWFPLGIYVITSVSLSHSLSDMNLSVSFKDKMCLLNGEVAGTLSASTQFDLKEYDDINGQTIYEKVKIQDIILEAVHHLGNEALEKILISDIEDQIKQVMRWTGSSPIQIKYNENIAQSAEVQLDPNFIDSGFKAYSYGSDIGYIQTDFVQPEELIANAGDNLCSILDKIKNFLGNFEQFYDVEGNFIFREKKNYLNTSQVMSVLNDLSNKDYVANTNGKISQSFNDSNIISSFNNNPQQSMVKNDFIVWGLREDKTNGLKYPIRQHLAIDEKPRDAAFPQKDWRTVLYETSNQDADYGSTYNAQYEELQAEWPKLFDMNMNDFKPEVKSNPSGIDQYLDFLDSPELISELGIQSIGRRTKVITDNSVNCIFEPQIPNLVWLSLADPDIADKRAEYITRGEAQCQIADNIYSLLALGGTFNSAFNVVRNLLYQATSYNETVSIQCLPIYQLEPNTLVEIVDNISNISGNQIINSISLPLNINGEMLISCARALERV